MIIPGNNIKTETFNTKSSLDYGIGDMGFILDILRSKLYKNPIMAIIREYSCNARDANREVGNGNIPIEITLPTSFDPHLRIKDSGPGISPERMELFVKFGSSTKRDSNEFLGTFGLGAKAAFAYADTFSVTTIVNGTKRTYSAFIDETKVGKMVLLSEDSTLEPNGTTIIIPVLTKDISLFDKEVVESTKYWKVKPTLKGKNPIPVYPELKPIHSGKDWELLSSNNVSYYDRDITKSIALIDGIPYAIEVSNLPKLSYDQKKLLNNKFLLSFNIGELSLVPSRDSLQYDDTTQKLIKEKLVNLTGDLSKNISDRISQAPAYLAAVSLYKETIASLNLGEALFKDLMWQGNKIITDPMVAHLGNWAICGSYNRYKDKISHRTNTTNKSSLLNTDPRTSVFFFKENQVPRYIIEHLFSVNSTLTCIKVICLADVPDCYSYTSRIEKGETILVEYDWKLLSLLEIKDLNTVVADIPKKARKVREKTPENTIPCYNLTDYDVVNTTVTNDSSGVYLEYDYKTRKLFFSDTSKEVPKWINFSYLNQLAGQKIYAFSKTKIKKLKSNWIPLNTALDLKIKELGLTESFLNDLSENSFYIASYNLDHYLVSKLSGKQNNLNLNDSSIFKEYLIESEKIQNSINLYYKYYQLLIDLGKAKLIIPNSTRIYNQLPRSANCKLKLLKTQVDKKYPLLRYISPNLSIEPIIEYINLIDKKIEPAL
jgi:hypothetical protein